MIREQNQLPPALADVLGEAMPQPSQLVEPEQARAELEASVDQRVAILRREDRRTKLLDLGWPVRALDAARTADTSEVAITELSAWQPGEHCVALLMGPKGVGKTVAAAHWALRTPAAPRFLRATAFARASRYEAEQWDRWMAARALVLDDLSTEFVDAKGSFRTDLDELVDTYYADRRPLIITTNANFVELENRYGERVVDRLRECALVIPVIAHSFRGRGRP